MSIQVGVAPAMEQSPKVMPESRILPGQEITANEMTELIMRHRLCTGFIERGGVWHASMDAAVSPSARCFFEARGKTIFDAVADVRARLGNELYMTLYADAIKQTPVSENLSEV